MYINLVTGKTYGVTDLKELKGNIVNRGLEKDYLYIPPKGVYALEYSRLVNSLRDTLQKGTTIDNVGLSNVKKGIKDIQSWLYEDNKKDLNISKETFAKMQEPKEFSQRTKKLLQVKKKKVKGE